MKTYISILRGINVSGQKMIKMADLKVLYEELGFTNVQTYIQSGNVVFESQETNPDKLQELIFNQLKKHYGFDVPNLILTPQEIEEALKNNPYQQYEKMYFTFLDEIPLAENLEKLKAFNYVDEYYEQSKKVIFFYSPNGYGNAKMNNNFFENKLKVKATTRNLNTVKKLLKMSTFI